MLSAFLSVAAQNIGAQSASSVCTFAGGKQLSVRYTPWGAYRLPDGQVREPDRKPVRLFTQAALVASVSEIPVGAFSIYLLPTKKHWTLIVNRNVTAGSAYDQSQDVLRIPMEIGS